MKITKQLKVSIAVIAMIVSMSVCNAQNMTSGSVEGLKKAGVALVDIDYSKAVIMGMGEQAFASYEEEWNKDLSDITLAFINGINEKTGTLLSVGHSIDCDLVMKIQVISISERGEWKCKAIVTDKQNQNLCEIDEIISKGCKIGTKMHHIKVGASNAGNKLGKFLAKQIKKLK